MIDTNTNSPQRNIVVLAELIILDILIIINTSADNNRGNNNIYKTFIILTV